MPPIRIQNEYSDTSRGRIIDVLRRASSTVDELAAQLGITGNAVRAQLAALERDGLVRAAGTRRGATRPSRLYELTPELEHLLSRAYMPLLTHLIAVVAARESAAKFDAIMRDAGRGLAKQLSTGFPAGTHDERVAAASQLMNRELGASTTVKRTNGKSVIRGGGCPLAAITGKHREVCHAIESLLAELLGATVHECCDRTDRPRCCFEISQRPGATRRSRGSRS